MESQDRQRIPDRLSKPAYRALTAAGYFYLDQIAAVSETELLQLHGMGPKGIRILRQILAEHGLTFAEKN